MAEDRGPVAGVGGRVGKLGKFGISHGKGEGHVVHAGVNCVCIMCVVPPTHVGAWSMAVLPGQPFMSHLHVCTCTHLTCMHDAPK